jgi:hypothetical protein
MHFSYAKNCENIIYLVIYDFLIIRYTLNVMSKSKKNAYILRQR